MEIDRVNEAYKKYQEYNAILKAKDDRIAELEAILGDKCQI